MKKLIAALAFSFAIMSAPVMAQEACPKGLSYAEMSASLEQIGKEIFRLTPAQIKMVEERVGLPAGYVSHVVFYQSKENKNSLLRIGYDANGCTIAASMAVKSAEEMVQWLNDVGIDTADIQIGRDA